MLPDILQRVKDHGFVVFDGERDFDLNIVGLRNPTRIAGRYDDLLFVCFKVGGQWIEHKFVCTTDAGLYYLNKPMRTLGTAILVHPQQCRSVYKLDLHRGKYLALCQRNTRSPSGGKVKVWRDNNKDEILDMDGTEYEGMYGINIHRASASTAREQGDLIGRYSAGCTVIADPEEFAVLIEACKMQINTNGWDTFTYTLIEGKPEDFK